MKTRKSRIFSFLTAAVLTATGILAGSTFPTRAATNLTGADGNDGHSPVELSDVTLLVGDGNSLAGSTVAQTITNADNYYI